MRGRRPEYLVACCRSCHEQAELDAGRKVSPRMANRRMAAVARAVGHTLPGICSVCRKNPTARRKTVCGKCKREQKAAQSPPQLPSP